MTSSVQQRSDHKPILNRMFLFPGLVLVIYALLFVFLPDKTLLAIHKSGKVLLSMLVPLGLIFVLMLLINLFLKPAMVVKFIGKGSGIKCAALSAAAGIISTGPIYAWYPLLKDLKEKGAGDYSISIFLYNRAVKPFLLPVMVAYFSWLYVVTLTILTVLASVFIGYTISIFTIPKSK